jgi:signal transduction histidine kinase
LQHVLNSIEALIFVSHLETGEILMINDFGVRLFGGAVGKKCWEVFQSDRDVVCDECIRKACVDAEEEPESREVRRWQKFNSLTGRWFECSSTVIPWTDPPQARLEISVDITENKKVEEELRRHRDELGELVQEQTEELRQKNEALEKQGLRAQEMAVQAREASESKSAFLANMSHEIRTPINAIMGFAELLQESPLSEEAGEFVQIILQNAEALLHLVNDVLDFSRIEARKLVLETIACNLRDIMEDVSHSLALGAQKKGVELVCAVDPALPEVIYGDPARIRQILLNLGNNAVKFTSQGEVVLSAELEHRKKGSSGILFAVRDTGEGISKEKQGRLFQKFGQVDASTSRNYGGSGLGLVISKGLVEMMGGEIGVESVEGKGSLFWFFLPVVMSASPPEAPQGVANLRLLLALSEESAAKALHRQLAFWNMRPLRIAPEKISLQLRSAREEGDPFGLLFVDFPSEEGVLENLLGDPERESLLSDTRVVLLEPLESRQKKSPLKEQAKIFVLSKPYGYRELLHVVMAGGHGL